MTEELMREQVLLLRQQNKTLLNIATHTRLVYVLTWVWLVGGVIALAIAAGSSSDGGGPAVVILFIGGIVLAGIAFGTRNIEKVVSPLGDSAMAE